MGEFGVVEDFANQSLGEQMLNQHLIDGVPADVGIKGLLAESEKIVECRLELLVFLVGFLDFFVQTAGEVRHAILEFLDRLFEALDVGFGVGVKAVEEVAKPLGI